MLPPGAREEHVAADGGTFRVLRGADEGDGLPILLVHGGGADNAAISWYRLIEPLSAQRPVLAPDLPGFGYTTGVATSTTAAGMADQLRTLLGELGYSRVIVCGVSMGGEVALQFALRHEHVCAGLVAVAAGGLVERYKSPWIHRLAWFGTRLPDAVLLPLAAVANRFVKAVLTRMVTDPSSLPPAVVEEFAREARRPRAGHAYARYNQATIGPRRMRNNMLPMVTRISVPTLLFHGTRDPLVTPEGSREAARRMPHAELVDSVGSGHWAQLEAHDHFLDVLRPFLAKVSG